MLTAQTEEKMRQLVSRANDSAVLAGFGTVLNSVQGLQQRLGGFSFDSISKAEEATQTLILRLSDVERRLYRLADIQRLMTTVRKQLTQAATQSIELPNLQVLDNPARVHAIVQTNNLIRFPRANKTLKEIGRSFSPAPVLKFNQVDSDKTGTNSATVKQAETNDDAGETPTLESQAAAASQLATEKTLAMHSATRPLANLQPALPEEQPALNEDWPLIATDERVGSLEFPPKEIEVDGAAAVAGTEEKQPTAVVVTGESSTEELPLPEMEGLSRDSANFDQRLLDDLIKNYGEFVVSPNLPIPIAEPPANPSRQSHVPVAGSGVQTPETKSKTRNVPSVRKEGELDRELKKLIKNYGEYDLYSRQSPINLKTGGIAAFLLLAALFCGFYFFYSPKSASPDGTQSDGRSSSDAPKIATGSSKDAGDHGEKALASPDTAREQSHRTPEAGEPQSRTKKDTVEQNQQ